MFFYRLKNFIRVLAAAVATFICFAAVGLASVCKLSDHGGERTFYLDSPSSQGLRKTELGFSELFRIKGETVRFKTEKSEEEFLKETLAKYQASVCFTERTDEILSYYCYSKRLGSGIVLNGQTVNLHIAWKEGEAVLGTPIIFDGY
ncbi:MAG: YwmB family TATA-box binding protein [Clostridia bacterium]|nr:YwmB family TATA-box binding protein [Clostridia bacterium]